MVFKYIYYSQKTSDTSQIINPFLINNSILQNPEWLSIIYPKRNICLFYLIEDSNIISSATVIENHRFAKIQFGPLSKDLNSSIDLIISIKNYYIKKHFIYLDVQLGLVDTVCYSNNIKLIKEHFNFRLENDFKNWSTVIVNLIDDENSIYSKFSENHKRSIKKATKEGFFVREINSENEILEFAMLYDCLYHKRNIEKPFKDSKSVFLQIFKFFNKNNLGFFLGVYSKDGILMGGICLAFQGNTVIYQFGTSGKNENKVPILHLAFYEAFKITKKRGFSFFDLGGYNRYVDIKNQVYNINRFKLGFSNDILDYPPSFYFVLSKSKFWIYSILKKTHIKFTVLLNKFLYKK
ncbi:MAG: hypothetical protein A2033_07835 [Bacteroidetes bacterium GWA2_31_9]|nr:MAG: hypothetical protein A2033_07835 [Bacteroidetes bacterium GWA2_31_9]